MLLALRTVAFVLVYVTTKQDLLDPVDCVVVLEEAGFQEFGAEIVHDLLQGGRVQIEYHAAVQQVTAQLEQRVQRDGRDVRLRPSTAAFLHVLLELDPSGRFAPLLVRTLAAELLELAEQRMRFVRAIQIVLAQNELNALGRRSYFSLWLHFDVTVRIVVVLVV